LSLQGIKKYLLALGERGSRRRRRRMKRRK
jgi:hypothetical protein